MPPLIACVAAILFSTVAMTMVPLMGWRHSSSESLDQMSAQEQMPETPAAMLTRSGAGRARVKARCEECGVIESMRRVAPEGISPSIYEITVRLGDGSTDVFSDATPANWRPGERIILIGGRSQSGI